MRGDLVMIAPDGQKLFSIIAVKRKLGLAPAAEPREKVEGAQVEPRPPARPTVQVIEID